MELNSEIDGIAKVIEVKKSYAIIKIDNSFMYLEIPYGQNLYIDENIKITGIVGSLPTQNYYSFNFKNYLESKNVFYQLNDANFTIIGSNSIRYYFWKFVGESGVNDLVSALLLNDHSSDNVIYSGLNNLSVSFVLNFSGISGFIIIYFTNKLRSKKVKLTIQFFIVIIMFFYMYLLNFPLNILRWTCLFCLNIYCWTFKRKLKKINMFCISLISIGIIKPLSLFSSSWFYIIVAVIGYSIFDYKTRFHWLKLWILSIIIFAPLQIFYEYKINFLSELVYTILLPILCVLEFIVSVCLMFNAHSILDTLASLCTTSFNLIGNIHTTWNIGKINVFYIIFIYVLSYLVLRYGLYLQIPNIMCCVILSLMWLFVFSNGLIGDEISLNMLNVGNGNSFVLINKPERYTFIFDAGAGKGHSDKTLNDFLTYNGINNIEYVFLSHSDSDHINEYEDITINFNVKNTVGPEAIEESYEYFKIKNTEVWAFNAYLQSNRTDTNDRSNVYYVKVNGNSILFMGDATIQTEALLLNDDIFMNIVNEVDYYQVGHHGSDTSSSYAFIQAMHPGVCLISGEDRGNLHFPKPSVIGTLEANNCEIYTTNSLYNYKINLQSNIVTYK